MRYIKYLNMSCNKDDINIFRDLKISLQKNNEDKYANLVKKIEKNYNIENSISTLLEVLNKNLSYRFKGKYRFNFTFDESINLNEIKLKNDKKLKKKLKKKLFEINDIFSKSKLELEKKIKEK